MLFKVRIKWTRTLSEKLFSFSNEEYIDKLILEYYIPSNDGRFQIEKFIGLKTKIILLNTYYLIDVLKIRSNGRII